MSSPVTLLSAGCSSSGIVFAGMDQERRNKKETQKRKKREIDRRHREKKKKEAAETKNKLDITIKENETLRCQVAELKQENNQLRVREQQKSIDPRREAAETKHKLGKAIKEKESLRCLVEKLKQENDQLKEQLKSIELIRSDSETRGAELRREIECLWICIAELSEKMGRSRH